MPYAPLNNGAFAPISVPCLLQLPRSGEATSILTQGSVSNDTPYSESLFGSMKYSPAYPAKPFESLEAARTWVHAFVTWYNSVHRHRGIQYVTPNERHHGKDGAGAIPPINPNRRLRTKWRCSQRENCDNYLDKRR